MCTRAILRVGLYSEKCTIFIVTSTRYVCQASTRYLWWRELGSNPVTQGHIPFFTSPPRVCLLSSPFSSLPPFQPACIPPSVPDFSACPLSLPPSLPRAHFAAALPGFVCSCMRASVVLSLNLARSLTPTLTLTLTPSHSLPVSLASLLLSRARSLSGGAGLTVHQRSVECIEAKGGGPTGSVCQVSVCGPVHTHTHIHARIRVHLSRYVLAHRQAYESSKYLEPRLSSKMLTTQFVSAGGESKGVRV